MYNTHQLAAMQLLFQSASSCPCTTTWCHKAHQRDFAGCLAIGGHVACLNSFNRDGESIFGPARSPFSSSSSLTASRSLVLGRMLPAGDKTVNGFEIRPPGCYMQYITSPARIAETEG